MPYYWRLSSFYFFYFAAVGALLPYWTLYLQSLGFDEYQIGLFMGLTTLIKIVSPNVWGWLADRTGRPVLVVRFGALITALAFVGVFATRNFAWLAVVMLVANFFSAAMLPQVEAIAMQRLGDARDRYGQVRLWGSIGFIIAVIAGGALVDSFGVTIILPLVLSMYGCIVLLTLTLDESDSHARADVKESSGGESQRWRPSLITVLFIVCGLLMQASHGPFYTFFTIELADLGYSKMLIGMLWALGVVCEVGIFLIMDRVFRRFAVPQVLLASFVIAALRWALLAAFGEHFIVLVLVQSLHAVTFGAWHAASIKFIYHHFPAHAHHRGQALYGSLSFGVGSAVGSYMAGVSWSTWGASASWQLASVTAALAAVLVIPVMLSAWQAESRGASNDDAREEESAK